uniref:Uncharacterized protein n=1 Tax=Arcella intermedia TaxID=1963864 RepID=A0A6B2LPG6_9EUKA
MDTRSCKSLANERASSFEGTSPVIRYHSRDSGEPLVLLGEAEGSEGRTCEMGTSLYLRPSVGSSREASYRNSRMSFRPPNTWLIVIGLSTCLPSCFFWAEKRDFLVGARVRKCSLRAD